MKRFLKNKADGTIYYWHPVLAKNPKCEEVTEEQAFPEKFVKPEAVKKVQASRAKKKTTLDLETKEIPEPMPYTLEELNEEASRGLPE